MTDTWLFVSIHLSPAACWLVSIGRWYEKGGMCREMYQIWPWRGSHLDLEGPGGFVGIRILSIMSDL